MPDGTGAPAAKGTRRTAKAFSPYYFNAESPSCHSFLCRGTRLTHECVSRRRGVSTTPLRVCSLRSFGQVPPTGLLASLVRSSSQWSYTALPCPVLPCLLRFRLAFVFDEQPTGLTLGSAPPADLPVAPLGLPGGKSVRYKLLRKPTVRNSVLLSLALRITLCSLGFRFAFACGECPTGAPLSSGPQSVHAAPSDYNQGAIPLITPIRNCQVHSSIYMCKPWLGCRGGFIPRWPPRCNTRRIPPGSSFPGCNPRGRTG